MMSNAPDVHNVWLNSILDEDTPVATRAKEAREYLGVCGFVKPQKIQAQSVHAHLTLDEIEKIKERARLRALEANVICQTEVQETGSVVSEGQLDYFDFVEGEFSESE
jgi:hypothetical protein